MSTAQLTDLTSYRRTLRRIIRAYDSWIVRGYCFVRFTIINLNMLHMLSLCLRRKQRVLEIGCGFGLFACYFAARDPDVEYHGIDLSARRIAMAREAARRLGLTNVRFERGDAREALALQGPYDAVVMMDLMHHIPDDAKARLLEIALPHLAPDGHLVIKDVTRRPWPKLLFTWLLDVLMTAGFDMWYWDERRFRQAIPDDWAIETYPINDWLPYPHVLYLVTRSRG